jgi:hypothetical protein
LHALHGAGFYRKRSAGTGSHCVKLGSRNESNIDEFYHEARFDAEVGHEHKNGTGNLRPSKRVLPAIGLTIFSYYGLSLLGDFRCEARDHTSPRLFVPVTQTTFGSNHWHNLREYPLAHILEEGKKEL